MIIKFSYQSFLLLSMMISFAKKTTLLCVFWTFLSAALFAQKQPHNVFTYDHNVVVRDLMNIAEAIENNDKRALKKLSVKRIKCVSCPKKKTNRYDPTRIKRRDFVNYILNEKNELLNISNIDFHRLSFHKERNYEKDLIIQTYLKSTSPTHSNLNYRFILLKKEDGIFKLAGIQ